MALGAGATTLIAVAIIAGLVGLGVGFVASPIAHLTGGARAAPASASTPPGGRVAGFVLDSELVPIQNASIAIIENAAEFHSGEDGSYEGQARPGTYLVIASAPGYRSAAASITVVWGESVRYDFILESRPVGTPYHETIPFRGTLGCQIGASGNVADCSAATTATVCCTTVPVPATVANGISEVVWSPGTDFDTCARTIATFKAGERTSPVGDVLGHSPTRVWLLGLFLHANSGPDGGELGLKVQVGTTVLLDDGNCPYVGAALDQAFDVKTTLFHYEPGPGNFTVLR